MLIHALARPNESLSDWSRASGVDRPSEIHHVP
jgi:hypothetical protein